MTTEAADTETDAAADAEPADRSTSIDSLLIQLARLEHVPYLRRLKEQVMANRYRPADDDAEFQRWRDTYCTDEYFQRLLADPETTVLAIGSTREPAGMMILRRHDDHLEVDDLLVVEPHRGFGTRLLRAALAYAQAWRKPAVTVDVYPGNSTADAFLRHRGFEPEAESTNELGRPMLRYAYRLED